MGRPSMEYWLDTEFIARPFAIDLISVGVVAENGREFYAESSEVDWSKANRWTLANVRPQLDGKGTQPHDFVNRREPTAPSRPPADRRGLGRGRGMLGPPARDERLERFLAPRIAGRRCP